MPPRVWSAVTRPACRMCLCQASVPRFITAPFIVSPFIVLPWQTGEPKKERKDVEVEAARIEEEDEAAGGQDDETLLILAQGADKSCH